MHLNQGIIMAAIVSKATGRLEEVGGFLVKRKKRKAKRKERQRGREGKGAREGRECVV